MQAFLTARPDLRHHSLDAVLALDSGAGPGESFGLDWGDLNATAGNLSIRRSLEDLAGYLRLKPTKRKTRKRNIRLSKHTLTALEEHRERERFRGFGADNDPMFTDTRGSRLRNGNLTKRSFKPLLELAGLPELRLYDLRHTCATLLLLAKVPAKVVSERLGHASITITLNTYSHVLPEMQEGAADALQDVFTRIWSKDAVRPEPEAPGVFYDEEGEPFYADDPEADKAPETGEPGEPDGVEGDEAVQAKTWVVSDDDDQTEVTESRARYLLSLTAGSETDTDRWALLSGPDGTSAFLSGRAADEWFAGKADGTEMA